MTGAGLASALVEHGLDPSELAAKRSLFDMVLAAFGTIADGSMPDVWWVPGRLEVFGKHTDYAGGRTLVAAVPRGFAVAARARTDGRVCVLDAGRGERVEMDPAAEDPSFGGWRHYVQVVARRLARNFPGVAIGGDLVVASDLPRASGMSSSSALVIGVSAALVRVSEVEGQPGWRQSIRGPLDAAGYFACIENGLTFGGLQGDAGVGTHGGSEDHAAILTAGAGHVSGFAFVPLRRIDSVRVPAHWRFVVAPSGVAAEKTGAARESFNRLAHGADLLLQLWNRVEPPAASLAAAAGSASAASRLRDIVRRSSIAGWSPAALERRLDHFINEDARIPAALEAFRDADAGALSGLSGRSQADAETLIENQVGETVSLARSARERGAFAACSFGAGFGGSVWALVDRADDGFAARWHPGAFVAAPGPPLTELTRPRR